MTAKRHMTVVDQMLEHEPETLLALGSLGAERDSTAERRAAAAQRAVSRKVADIYLDQLELDVDAPEQVQEWLHNVPDDARLRVNVHGSDLEIATQVAQHVQRCDRVQSAVAVNADLVDEARFHWPLQFGIPAHEADVAGALQMWGYHDTLTEVRTPLGSGQSVDVVFVTSVDVDFLYDVQVGLLVVLVDVYNIPPLMLVDLAEQVDAAAICVLGADPDEVVPRFLDELSHNLPPDRVLAEIAQVLGRPYAFVASPNYLSTARITSVTASVRADLESALVTSELGEGAFDEAMRRIGALSYGAGMFFDAESQGATATREVLAEVDEVMDSVGTQLGTVATSSERHLQAQIFATDPVRIRRHHAFMPGGVHEIDVRIGLSDADWLALATPFPDSEPPDDGNDILRVNLVMGSDLQAKDILLPAFGESTVARFEVDIPDDADTFQATIVVWRGLSQLQTAVLSGPIHDQDEPHAGQSLTLSSGDPAGIDLDLRKDPDLAFRRLEGAVVVARAGSEVSVPSGPGDPSATAIRARLFETATTQDGLDVPLDDEDVVSLITELAIRGAYLRRYFFRDDPLDDVHHVEVTVNNTGDFFPVEFFYDYGTPDDDAQLCTEFATAQGPECPDCLARGDSSYVCPSGFWSLSRLVERQVRTESAAETEPAAAPEPTSVESSITASANVIFAASDVVNETDANRVDTTVAELQAIVGAEDRVHSVGTWDAWADAVGDNAPALLAALAHTVPAVADLQALQIAADQELRLDKIRPIHLTVPGAPAPLMLLFACNGANPTDSFDDFVRAMRIEGAGVVVASLTFVLGQHAAPAVLKFVRAIWDVDPQPIGEMMRHVRAEMLRDDNPLALALVAYGSADWRFAGKNG